MLIVLAQQNGLSIAKGYHRLDIGPQCPDIWCERGVVDQCVNLLIRESAQVNSLRTNPHRR